eukprot:CAMPEP_0185786058 /NCGR_PEP_ID=MMETSP1174-20130828/133233_1 /TAXON_ID=35687 /ORGANISM="Dictyocha speculum, Strain CCMP1381" /LENGTH=82 /DNA_ID=CAMNT_0028478475 /DNA_START=74 /DNA_END=319 /DNA_ORIENTATION=-
MTLVKAQKVGHNRPTSQIPVSTRRETLVLAQQKYLMSFPEFGQFIRDFKIVGGQGQQALLTISECTEIYLAIAPEFSSADKA